MTKATTTNTAGGTSTCRRGGGAHRPEAAHEPDTHDTSALQGAPTSISGVHWSVVAAQ